MNLPNPPLPNKDASQKPQVLQSKKIQELLESNREIIKKLPELLFKQLEYYEKAHLDESTEISKTIEDGNFLEELSNFKQASFEFVKDLAKMKKNFTTLLTREQEPSTIFERKKTSNFDVFVAQHCENVVKHHVHQISKIDVMDGASKMERE